MVLTHCNLVRGKYFLTQEEPKLKSPSIQQGMYVQDTFIPAPLTSPHSTHHHTHPHSFNLTTLHSSSHPPSLLQPHHTPLIITPTLTPSTSPHSTCHHTQLSPRSAHTHTHPHSFNLTTLCSSKRHSFNCIPPLTLPLLVN